MLRDIRGMEMQSCDLVVVVNQQCSHFGEMCEIEKCGDDNSILLKSFNWPEKGWAMWTNPSNVAVLVDNYHGFDD